MTNDTAQTQQSNQTQGGQQSNQTSSTSSTSGGTAQTARQKNYVALEKTADDLFLLFKVWVEVDSVVEAGFREVSGLNMERRVDEVEEGGVNDHVHILPGRNRYGNIVLKYGLTTSQTLWDWYQAGIKDLKIIRHKVSILVRGVNGQVVKAWSAADAFPCQSRLALGDRLPLRRPAARLRSRRQAVR